VDAVSLKRTVTAQKYITKVITRHKNNPLLLIDLPFRSDYLLLAVFKMLPSF